MRRRARRIGLALAGVALAVTPAAARQRTPIEDRLITELEGFVVQPDGDFDQGMSGPIDGALALGGYGIDTGGETIDGYCRRFRSDEHSGSDVRVVGVDIAGRDPAEVLARLVAGVDWYDGPTQVFADADPPLDGLVSYAFRRRLPTEEVRVEVAAYVAGDLLVIIEVEGNVNWTEYLLRAAKAQVALTPATATPGFEPVPGRPVEPEPEPEPAAEPEPEPAPDDDTVAAAPEPRSGLVSEGEDPLPLPAVGAAVVVVVVGLAVRGGGNRKRVRRPPQP